MFAWLAVAVVKDTVTLDERISPALKQPAAAFALIISQSRQLKKIVEKITDDEDGGME